MAVLDLRNPSGLYGGGATFNPHDYTAIAERVRAAKAARDEAIDNYYKNLPNTLNDKGVRDVDVPYIAKAKDAIQQFWASNRGAINKGNTPQAIELAKRFNDVKGLIQESKNRANTDLQLGKERLSGKSEHVFSNPEFIIKLANHNKPVIDPTGKAIDIASDFEGPKPFDENKYIQGFKDVKYSEGVPTRQPHPTDKYSLVETTTPVLNDDSKKVIYARAVDAYHNDPSFRDKIDNQLAGTGQIPKLQEVSKNVFGKDIETPEDLASAYTASIMPTPQVKSKTVRNEEAFMADKNAEWDRRNKITFGQSLSRIAANKKAQEVVDTPYLTDEYFDRYGKQLTEPEAQAVYKTTGLSPIGYINASDIHPNDYNTITGRDLTKKVGGVKPLTVGDRSVFLVDANGDWIGEGSQRISREAVRNTNIEKRVNTKSKATMEQNKKPFSGTTPPVTLNASEYKKKKK